MPEPSSPKARRCTQASRSLNKPGLKAPCGMARTTTVQPLQADMFTQVPLRNRQKVPTSTVTGPTRQVRRSAPVIFKPLSIRTTALNEELGAIPDFDVTFGSGPRP